MKLMSRFLGLAALAVAAVGAQSWAPVHIVAITDYPRFAWISKRAGDVVSDALSTKTDQYSRLMYSPGLRC
jgi:hypothetical protein